MTSTKKDPVLVVVQLSGGNDAINTVVPYGDPHYYDHRPNLGIPQDQVLAIDDHVGFHPAMQPLKDLYDQGKVAVIQGVGFPNCNRSHFRSMDVWHTCEPDKLATEGWLGRTIRDLDPNKENVLTGINYGRGLPHALTLPGVPVASVANLEAYGLLTGIEEEERIAALDMFSRMYSPAMGGSFTYNYLSQTGMDAFKGADILKTVPDKYTSSVEYGNNPVARYLRMMAMTIVGDVGARILYTTAPYNSFDLHGSSPTLQAKLWTDVSNYVRDFFDDLHEQNLADNVIMLLFTEFGRRVRDNGNGTDHGTGGVALVVGDKVKGGLYSEYPSLAPEKQADGDLQFNYDFRGLYATILEQWMGLDSKPIVNGSFEQLAMIEG
jgi:uncharacterized protein (DUF1501 family)